MTNNHEEDSLPKDEYANDKTEETIADLKEPDNNSKDKKSAFDRFNIKSIKETKFSSFKKDMQSKDKKDSDSSELTLKQAYDLLHIKVYPPTNEEIRIAYYREDFKCEGKDSEVLKEQLKQARALILDNLSINPFLEENAGNEQESKQKHAIKLGKIKKPRIKPPHAKKHTQKKNVSELIGKARQTEAYYEPTPKPIKKAKKSIFRFILLMGLGIGILYISFINSTKPEIVATVDTTDTTKEQITPEQSKTAKYIDLNTAVYLTQKDGISIEKETLYPKKERITDFTCSQSVYIPGTNTCILTREFILHNSCASIKIKNKALYSHAETNDIGNAYKKIKDWSSYEILDISLDGTWTGECTINNKHILKGNQITLSLTDNGYVSGKYSFRPAIAQDAILLVEGYYDTEKNDFSLQGKDWIKRPSLFVTPSLVGYYNPVTDTLDSNIKYSNSATFTFKKEVPEESVISKQVAFHLLKDSSATYTTSTNTHNIPLSELKELTDITVLEKGNETCKIQYTAILNRDIMDYEISGQASFYKSEGMWLLKDNEATATFKQINLCGTYKGTELIDDKEYNCTYKIYPQGADTFRADISIKPTSGSFKPIKETRIVTFIDKGIQMERIDLFDKRLVGDNTKETYMDYENDVFKNEKGMSLYKVSDTY